MSGVGGQVSGVRERRAGRRERGEQSGEPRVFSGERGVGDVEGFRFRKLLIWQRAADLAIKLDEVACQLDERKKYRFAEQLRAAGLSISNNIAEGSGSNSTPDFRKFLFIARKSAFECASMLLIFQRRN